MLSELESFRWFVNSGLFNTVHFIDYVPDRATASFELELSSKGKAAYQRVLEMPRLSKPIARTIQLQVGVVKGDDYGREGAIAGRVFSLKRLVIEQLLKGPQRGQQPAIQKVDIDNDDDPADSEIKTPPAPVYVDILLPRKVRVSSRRRHRWVPSSYAPKVPDDYFKQLLLRKLRTLDGSEPIVRAIEQSAATSVSELMLDMPEPEPTYDEFGELPTPLLGDLLPSDWLFQLSVEEDAVSEGVARLTHSGDRALLELSVSEWRRGLSFRALAVALNNRGHVSRQGTLFNSASARNLVIQGLLYQASARHLKDQ